MHSWTPSGFGLPRPPISAALGDVFRRASMANEGDRADLAAHPEVLVFVGEGIADGRTRVAEVDGAVIGFITTAGRPPTLELDDLFVDPLWMRRGVATRLVRDMVERARAAGVSRIEVSGNQHAAAFYRSAGFVVDGQRPTLFGPAPHLHLVLPPAVPSSG